MIQNTCSIRQKPHMERLWDHFKRGSTEALEVLKVYDRENTVNFFQIADIIHLQQIAEF